MWAVTFAVLHKVHLFFDNLQALFFVSKGAVKPPDWTTPWVGTFIVNMKLVCNCLSGGRERITGDIWRTPKLPWLLLGRQRGVKACSRG